MSRSKKLELTWVGKEDHPRLEPRILLEDTSLTSMSKVRGEDDIFDNMLIRGDNLLALKSLLSNYSASIKCVYLDPPYNTGSAFSHYDDGVEHSLWLSLMRDRLLIIRELMTREGHIFVQADDNEGHYLKVIMDEIFGRQNFVSTFIWRKVDSPNDNKVPVTPDHEFIFCYARDRNFGRLKQKGDESVLRAYRNRDEQGRLYRDRLLRKNGKNSLRSDRPTMFFPIKAPNGEIVLPIRDDGKDGCWAAGKSKVAELQEAGALVWKNRGDDEAPIWVPYTREYAPETPTRPYFSIWSDLHTTRQTKAHQKEIFGEGNEFSTPKPENLIARILEMASEPNDLILDSFAGSGTTGAVAHKMGRRWIMIEQGDHAETHIVPRMRKVISGDDLGGITEEFEWSGGGGFPFYRLAPSLLEKDRWGNWVISKEYNSAMLAEAMCKHMGFTYAPSQDPSEYWNHGYSSERDFIFVTTNALTHEMLEAISYDVGPDRHLLICCKAFSTKRPDAFQNLTMKRIPHVILGTCEWGRDDYSLKIASLPEVARADDEPKPEAATKANSTRTKRNEQTHLGLFDTPADVEN